RSAPVPSRARSRGSRCRSSVGKTSQPRRSSSPARAAAAATSGKAVSNLRSRSRVSGYASQPACTCGVANSTRVPPARASRHSSAPSRIEGAPSSPDGTTCEWTSTNTGLRGSPEEAGRSRAPPTRLPPPAVVPSWRSACGEPGRPDLSRSPLQLREQRAQLVQLGTQLVDGADGAGHVGQRAVRIGGEHRQLVLAAVEQPGEDQGAGPTVLEQPAQLRLAHELAIENGAHPVLQVGGERPGHGPAGLSVFACEGWRPPIRGTPERGPPARRRERRRRRRPTAPAVTAQGGLALCE